MTKTGLRICLKNTYIYQIYVTVQKCDRFQCCSPFSSCLLKKLQQAGERFPIVYTSCFVHLGCIHVPGISLLQCLRPSGSSGCWNHTDLVPLLSAVSDKDQANQLLRALLPCCIFKTNQKPFACINKCKGKYNTGNKTDHLLNRTELHLLQHLS